MFFFFFFNDTATTEIYTLSLHDALPISVKVLGAHVSTDPSWVKRFHNEARAAAKLKNPHTVGRSEEHTSELQSQSNLVCRLLLEKKKLESSAGRLRRRIVLSHRPAISTA